MNHPGFRFRHGMGATGGLQNGREVWIFHRIPAAPDYTEAGPGWGAVAVVTFVLGVVLGAFL